MPSSGGCLILSMMLMDARACFRSLHFKVMCFKMRALSGEVGIARCEAVYRITIYDSESDFTVNLSANMPLCLRASCMHQPQL